MNTDPNSYVIDLHGLGTVFEALRTKGYTVVGPTVRDAAIVYEPISSIADLPRGWTDQQQYWRRGQRESYMAGIQRYSLV